LTSSTRAYSETLWLVTIVTTFLKLGTILEFLFDWKLEDLLANRELAINLFLCKAKVDNIKETFTYFSIFKLIYHKAQLPILTYVLDSVEKLLRQRFFTTGTVKLRQIQGCEVRPIHYIQI
jgi:hypothetical protein